MTPPTDVSQNTVVVTLRVMWGIDTHEIAYAPVGFGAHHWSVTDSDGARWFVTLHDHGTGTGAAGRGLTLLAAFRAATDLEAAGLPFVVGPRAACDGSVAVEAARHRWLSVTPWLDAPRLPEPAAQTDSQLGAVVDTLARLHEATPLAVAAATDDLILPERERLDAALGHVARADDASAGPYAARARDALRENAAAVCGALERYDALAAEARTSRSGWVVTHGEPHWRNVLEASDGLRLVDWDTLLLAPPARDLWHAAGGATGPRADAVLAAYADRTGRVVDPDELSFQALRWDLTEVALYVAWFEGPHADDEDSATAWGGFTESVTALASEPGA